MFQDHPPVKWLCVFSVYFVIAWMGSMVWLMGTGIHLSVEKWEWWLIWCCHGGWCSKWTSQPFWLTLDAELSPTLLDWIYLASCIWTCLILFKITILDSVLFLFLFLSFVLNIVSTIWWRSGQFLWNFWDSQPVTPDYFHFSISVLVMNEGRCIPSSSLSQW